MRRLHILGKIFLFLPIILCTGCINDWYMWSRNYPFYFLYGGIFMRILFLIILGLIVYFIIKSTKSKRDDTSFKDTALDILKKRYAKGEITKEEFDKMRKDLES